MKSSTNHRPFRDNQIGLHGFTRWLFGGDATAEVVINRLTQYWISWHCSLPPVFVPPHILLSFSFPLLPSSSSTSSSFSHLPLFFSLLFSFLLLLFLLIGFLFISPSPLPPLPFHPRPRLPPAIYPPQSPPLPPPPSRTCSTGFQ